MSEREEQTLNENGNAEHELEQEATPAVDQPEARADNGANEELEALRKQSQTNLEGWQRTLAEFQNYKKRVERDLKDSQQNAAVDMLKQLLPIIDDFERAMENVPPELQGQPWLNGISLIQRKFNRLLEDNNVEPIDPKGETFDPNLHQAIGMDEDSDAESGQVTETLQKGYRAGDRVLRPALVKVAP